MEIVDVVSMVKIGSPGSYYLLVPVKLKDRLKIDEGTEFVIMIEDDKIVYQRKNGEKPNLKETTPQ